MPGKSSNVPSSIVYSVIGAKSLKIARASNNPDHSPQQLNHLLPEWVGRGYQLEK